MDSRPSLTRVAQGAGLLSLAALALTACGEDTPEFSEIEEDMWTAMEEADSVTIDGGGLVGEAALEDAGSNPLASDLGLEEGDEITATMQGAVDGAAVEMDIALGDQMTIQAIQIDDTVYMEATLLADAMESGEMPMGGAEVDIEALRGELEGKWIEAPNSGEGFAMTDAFEEIRSDLEEHSEDLEGTTEERDGVEAHVYSNGEEGDEEVEIVVSADEEEPYLLSATYDGSTATFSDWNETELPEAPSETVSETDLQMLLLEQTGM